MCCKHQTKCFMRLRDSIVILIEDWGVILGFGDGSLRYVSQIWGFGVSFWGLGVRFGVNIWGLQFAVWGLQPTLWGPRPTFWG